MREQRFIFSIFDKCVKATLAGALFSLLSAEEPVLMRPETAALIERIDALKKLPMGRGKSGYSIRDAGLRALFYQLDPTDYGHVVKSQNTPPDPKRQTEFDHLLMAAWKKHEPEAALAFLKENREDWENQSATYKMFSRLAAADPESSLAEAQALGKKGREQTFAILRIIAAESPERALELIPPGAHRADELTADILHYWAASDPEKTIPWIMKQERRLPLLRDLAKIWAEKDRVGGEKWVSSLAGDERIFAQIGLIREQMTYREGRVDLANSAALKFVKIFPSKTLSSATNGDQAIRGLAHEIGNNLPEIGEGFTKRSWLERFEQNVERDQLRDHLLDRWIVRHPSSALELIQEIPDIKKRDRWLRQYILKIRWPVSKKVISIAHEISDEQKKASALSDLYKQWFFQDTELAMESFKTLPKADRERIQVLFKRKADHELSQKWLEVMKGG